MVKRNNYDDDNGRNRKRSRRSTSPPPRRPVAVEGATVFIGNLSFDTSWQNLKDHMRKAGNVDSANVFQESNGRSKGCGLVSYQSKKEAQRAIRELDESMLDGRKIFVTEDKRDGDSGGGSGRGGGGSDAKVFVGNLSFDTSWQDLKDYFRQCGTVDHAEVPEYDTGRKKGFGLVRFSSPQDANTAIRKLDGTEFQGRRLEVRWDRDSDSKPAAAAGGGRGTHHEDDRQDRHGSTVFVGNLSFDTSWQDLKDLFRKCGTVDHVDIPENDAGRKRGYALVKMPTRDANAAIERFHEVEFQGRRLEVRMDRAAMGKRGDDGPPSQRGGGGGGADGDHSCQLFVGNLPFETSWQDLKDHFKQCGKVDHSNVIEGPDGRPKGFGIIKFFDSRDAERAIRTLDGVEFQGRNLQVRFDERR